MCGDFGGDVGPVIGVSQRDTWLGLLFNMGEVVRLELVGFSFGVSVLVNGGDVAGLPVRESEREFAYDRFDVIGNALEVYRRIFCGKMMPAMGGCDIVEVMGVTSGYRGVELSGNVSSVVWGESEVVVESHR